MKAGEDRNFYDGYFFNGYTKEGLGVPEQLILGPREPSRFTSLFDTAP